MDIKLSGDQITNLVMILGAAQACFTELSEDKQTPGIFKVLMGDYATTAEKLAMEITKQHNEQVK